MAGTAVLSHGTWMRRYGGAPSAIGRALTLNGQPYQIIGVLPETVAPRGSISLKRSGLTSDTWAGGTVQHGRNRARALTVQLPKEMALDEKALFTGFWSNESKTTRNVIARIPEGSDYRPDPKSRTAREIAWQIVCEEKMIIDALETGKAEWAPPPMPATMKEVLEAYEKQRDEMAARWDRLTAAQWDGNLEFFGQQRPASPMAWSFLFDIVHHRGQITTYLRPMGSTVPQIYGPSGDEP